MFVPSRTLCLTLEVANGGFHLEEISQYFRILVCKRFTAKDNGGLNACLDGEI